jgi:hypothetical protein
MTIKRVDRGKNHWYVDADTGERVPGITTILGNGLPKKALINWAGTATAEYAVDHWDELADMTPSVRLKTLQGGRYAARDAAANKGTRVHELAERLVKDEPVAVPDDLAGHVESYVRFLDEWDVEPEHVEIVVHSQQHNYCGTLDLIADLLDPDDPEPGARKRYLLDIKTSRSGIFGETALQLAGYRFADVWIDSDGEERVMPEVDACAGIHVRSDGYDLIPVEAGTEQLRQLLYVREVAEFDASSRDLVGAPLQPPIDSRWRLNREGA